MQKAQGSVIVLIYKSRCSHVPWLCSRFTLKTAMSFGVQCLFQWNSHFTTFWDGAPSDRFGPFNAEAAWL